MTRIIQAAPRPVSVWLWAALVLGVSAGGWVAWRGVPAFVTAAAPPPASPAEARQQQLLSANTGQPGDPDLGARFQAINLQHFDGALPAMPIRWEPGLAEVGPLMGEGVTLQGMFGRAGKRQMILLNPVVRDDAQALDRALCHEMVHAYLFSIGEESAAHGAQFQAVLQRLAAEGAFEGIAADATEKARLRAWLDAEAIRLDAQRRDLAEAEQELKSDSDALDREIGVFNARSTRPDDEARDLETRRSAVNDRVVDANARIQQARDDLAHFNAEVARYNLMIAYPDGLDQSAAMPIKR